MKEKPLYPFGFGLSYTSFRFDSITLSSQEIAAGAKVTATVSLTNTGGREAEEVVQIYIGRDGRGEDEPAFSLRAFRRVSVAPGGRASLEFEVPASAFETVGADGESRLLPGSYTVTAADAAPLPVAVEKGAPAPVTAKLTVK
jgi:beta-glucosidase